jgi:hypothetical protein
LGLGLLSNVSTVLLGLALLALAFSGEALTTAITLTASCSLRAFVFAADPTDALSLPLPTSASDTSPCLLFTGGSGGDVGSLGGAGISGSTISFTSSATGDRALISFTGGSGVAALPS